MVYNYVLDLPSPSKEKLHPEDITAVFDLDDMLWDLSGPVFRKAGTSFGLAVDFALRESPEITAAQRSRIIALFGEVDTFKNIQLYPAVAQLKALYDLGVNVMVKSNCLSQEIADAKYDVLKRALPYLDDRAFRLDVVDRGGALAGKELPENTTFFVDDSPLNIAKSTARYNLLPALSWNVSEHGMSSMRAKTFYIMRDLDVILQTILRNVLTWVR